MLSAASFCCIFTCKRTRAVAPCTVHCALCAAHCALYAAPYVIRCTSLRLAHHMSSALYLSYSKVRFTLCQVSFTYNFLYTLQLRAIVETQNSSGQQLPSRWHLNPVLRLMRALCHENRPILAFSLSFAKKLTHFGAFLVFERGAASQLCELSTEEYAFELRK